VVVTPAGVATTVVGVDGAGLKVETPCGNTATVGQGTPIKYVDVLIDPGHGGGEDGAVDPKGQGFTEKIVNLAVSKAAETALKQANVSVLLTHGADYRMPLKPRTDMAQALLPKVFVSVHHNGLADGPSAHPGTETYYQVDSPATLRSSKRLAGLLYEEVYRALDQYKGVSWIANRDAGAKYRRNTRGGDYYWILRQGRGVTSVIAELAFLSNPPERDLLTRPDVQQAEGQAVARAIIRYLRTADPGSGFVEPIQRDTPTGGGGAEGCVDPPLN
jgi:N-acetylmuramoyl-L-alanine amidase